MAILEQPPSLNDGAVARNPGVSWAFLLHLLVAFIRVYRPTALCGLFIIAVYASYTSAAGMFTVAFN